MSIEKFTATVKKFGLARANRFEVEIPLPEKLRQRVEGGGEPDSKNVQLLKKAVKVVQAVIGRNSSSGEKGLNMLCDAATLPGKNIVTTDNKTNGPAEQRPYGYMVEDITLTFLLTDEMYEKMIIDEWANIVVDPKTHEVGWHDDYVTDIYIHQLDHAGNKAYSIVLINAFPTNVASLDVSNDQTDTLHKLAVQFSYKKWVTAEEHESAGTDDAISELVPDFAKPFVNAQTANKVYEFATGQNPGFSGEALYFYDKISDVTKEYAGVSANELGSIVNTIKKDVSGSSRISAPDKTSLGGIADNVLNRIGF